VLFLHVMKTAGTTFMWHLRTQFAPEEIYPCKGVDWTGVDELGMYVDLRRLGAIPSDRLDRLRVIAGHFPFAARDLVPGELRTVTILREPVARTVSLLKHFKRLHPPSRDRSLLQIYEDPDRFTGFIENHQTRVMAIESGDGVRSVRDPIVIDERRFEVAVANLRSIDVLGVTERYDEMLAELRTRFGWWSEGTPPVLRANAAAEDWEVDDDLRARIAVDNSWDVALYAEAVEIAGARDRQGEGGAGALLESAGGQAASNRSTSSPERPR